MSKRANPTLIGAFVVGAVVIAVAAVILLGGEDLFRDKPKFVLFFEGSVKGLNVGAPVYFRGVKIGTVTDISIVVHGPEKEPDIPVEIEIDPSRLTLATGEKLDVVERIHSNDVIDDAVEKGLRAQLQLQSLLTGQLSIQLDFYENRPARLHGDTRLPEIPSIETPIQELGKTLEDYPLDEVMEDISSAMDGINRLVNSPDLHESMTAVNLALKQINETLKSAEQTFDSATATVDSMKDLVADDSEMLDALEETLRSISDAAQSVSELADAIERQPEALLRGKGPGEGK